MRNFLFSIRTRALLLVGLGFCVFTVLLGYQSIAERRMRLEWAKERVASSAKLVAAEGRYAIESTVQLVASMVRNREFGQFAEGEECRAHLARLVKREPRLANMLLVLPDGKLACDATGTLQPRNIGDSPSFKRALVTSGTVVGEAIESGSTGSPDLLFYDSVRDGTGRVQAVVVAELELAWLNRELASIRHPEGARIGLLDANGRILARYPDPEGMVGKDASDSALFKTIRAQGGKGVVEEIGLEGVRRIFGLTRFADTASGPISLWVGFDTASITAGAEHDFAWTVITAAAMLLLTFAAMWLGGERLLLRPISILSGAARRLAKGDLCVRTGLASSGSELGLLGRSFDEMAESLESKNRQIVLGERALKVLSTWNQTLLRPRDEQSLIGDMCRAIVAAGGYQCAWVGLAKFDEGKTIELAASCGIDAQFIASLGLTWADTPRGHGPAGIAIRRGTAVVVNDWMTNPDTAPWREKTLSYHFDCVVALPLKVDDEVIGALSIHSAEAKSFGEQEVVLLTEVAAALSSAIAAVRSHAARAQLEVSLQTSEERFRAAADASLDALLVLKSMRDVAGNIVDFEITDINARGARRLGLTKGEAVGKTFLQTLPVHGMAGFLNKYAQIVATRTPLEEEFSFDAPGAERKWFRQQVVAVGDGVAISLRNITAWKTAGDKLRESEERMRLAMAGAAMGAWSVDLESGVHTISDEIGPIFGLAKGAGPGSDKALMEAVHPDDCETLAHGMKQSLEAMQPAQREFRVVWPDGTMHWVEAHSNIICDGAGKPVRRVGVLADITQRKLDMVALQRANRALATLSEANQVLIHATSESELLREVCRVIVEKGGYLMAWVGYSQNDQERTITAMTRAGAVDGYVTPMKHTWADNEHGQRPIARAIRSGKAEISRNVRDDPAYEDVRELMARPGYLCNLAVPLLDGQNIIGAISIHAAEADAFDEAEMRLLQELADDLSYGIVTLRTREERDRIAHAHEHHAAILHKSLEDSIQAIAATVEMRDPYTSGHQKRVAELATVLAREMCLSEERIHGLHLAGVVHDLGKISVPAEILSKPGKLTSLEFMMMQGHAQAGYEILKDIDFPWPIATIVWQHHERLDGSGYPQRLKGEDVLLESRILAVADVVEAMASHRPYRPTLGIEVALQEIERGRGVIYDPAVADACLKLFREGRYALVT